MHNYSSSFNWVVWPCVQLIRHLGQFDLSLTGNTMWDWPPALCTTPCICWSCLVIVALTWQWACLTAWHNVHVEWLMFLWLLCETSSIKRCKVAFFTPFFPVFPHLHLKWVQRSFNREWWCGPLSRQLQAAVSLCLLIDSLFKVLLMSLVHFY